jgi:uncharacterized protein YggE
MRFAAAALFAALLMSPAAFAEGEICCAKDTTRLDVSAQADVKTTPDIAMVSSGVVTIAPTADQAMKDNATRMNAVFDAIKKAGIKEEDFQTSGLSLSPQYVYAEKQPPKIVNYQANNNVSIKIRDMKNIGPVLDALIAQGANQLNGPSFSVDEPDALMDSARKLAVKKAMERAKLLADAAGLKVKRIVSMSEGGGYSPPMPMMAKAMRMEMAADAGAPTPVAMGDVSMSVTVNMTVELE